MVYSVVIVEDDKNYVALLSNYFMRYQSERGDKFEIKTYRDGLDFLENYRPGTDIVMMDIEMPMVNGMEAAHRLRGVDKLVSIIFVTNFARFAVEGYEVDACGFLVKPVSYPSFCMQLDRTLRHIGTRDGSDVVIKSKGVIYKIPTNSVYYIEVSGMELMFHTSEGVIRARGSLNRHEKQLVPYNFSAANSCYLVNLRHVDYIKKDVVSVNGEELKISRGKKKSFTDALTDYLGSGGAER